MIVYLPNFVFSKFKFIENFYFFNESTGDAQLTASITKSLKYSEIVKPEAEEN